MHSRIVPPLLAALLLAAPAAAQVQPTPLPEYTDAQRWERASRMTTLGVVAAMAHARASGQTLEDFSRWWGDLFAPSWGQPGSYGPVQVLRGMRRNLLIDPMTKVEILSESDSLASARVNRYWVAHFGESGKLYDIGIDDYEALYAEFARRVAEYHGLKAAVAREGDDLVLTFSRR